MKLLYEIDGWRGFVANDPGYTFDGVDLIETDDGPEIVAGYGINAAKDRKQYTAEMRATLENMMQAQSGNITSIKTA